MALFLKQSTILLFSAALLCPLAAAADDDGIDIDIGVKTMVFFYNDVEGIRLSVDHGWSIGGEAIVWFPGGLGVGAEIEYYTMSEDFTPFAGIDVEADYSQMPICLNGYYRFGQDGLLKPYVGGGLAFVRTEVSAATTAFGMTVSVDLADSFTGWSAFAGMDIGDYFYCEMQWLQVDVDLGIDFAAISETDHSDASGLTLWVGVRF